MSPKAEAAGGGGSDVGVVECRKVLRYDSPFLNFSFEPKVSEFAPLYSEPKIRESININIREQNGSTNDK